MIVLYVRSTQALCCSEHKDHALVKVVAPHAYGVEDFTVIGFSRTAALGRACAFLRKKGVLEPHERPRIVEFGYGGHA